MHKKLWIIFFLQIPPLSSPATPFFKGGNTPDARSAAGGFYDWQPLPPNQSPCGGKYLIPELKQVNNSEIEADYVSYSQKALSILTGNVIYYEPERQLSSEKVSIHRDPKTQKFSSIQFEGAVTLQQKNLTSISDQAAYDFNQENITASHAQYHLYKQHGRGDAATILFHKKENYQFTDVTYTTCSPSDSTWQLKAKELQLDYVNNRGTAKQATFLIKDLPVLYLPYYSFPIEKKRSSGLLFPNYRNSHYDGTMLALPLYLNLAPNYDDTFIPEWIEKRNGRITNEFRYLTVHSNGELTLQVLPYDKEFAQYRDNELASPPPGLGPNSPQIISLQNASPTRWAIKAHHVSHINKNLDLQINYNQDSDSNFAEDFKEGDYVIGNITNLLQQATLSYHDPHWQNNVTVKNYQTLYPIQGPYVKTPYKLLPQVNTKAVYPKVWRDLNFNLITQFTNFNKAINIQDNVSTSSLREVINPKFSYSFKRDGGFVTPTFEVKQVGYKLDSNPALASYNDHASLTHPIFSIDSGLFFERDLSFRKEIYTQTLEPRLFYIYIPYQNQNNIPLFDSSFNSFSYGQLFRTNLFSGFDRQSNANEITYALTSNIVNIDSESKFIAQIGQSYFFAKNQVTACDLLDPNCQEPENPLKDTNFAPLTGNFKFTPNKNFTLGFEELIKPKPWRNYKSTLYLNYQEPSFNKQRLVEIGYSFVQNGDIQYDANGLRLFPGDYDPRNNLHEIKLAAQVPLNINWNVLGLILYNFKSNYIIDSLAGIEYESCCFAIRGGVRDYLFTRANVDSPKNYNYSFFVEFALKGVTSYGYGGNMSNFIQAKGVHNYENQFGKNF